MSERFWEPSDPPGQDKSQEKLKDWASKEVIAALNDFVDDADPFIGTDKSGRVVVSFLGFEKPKTKNNRNDIYKLTCNLNKEAIAMAKALADDAGIDSAIAYCDAFDRLAAEVRKAAGLQNVKKD